MTEMCRRCSECVGQDHHWCSEIRTDDGERLHCKHCDATAVECPVCDGQGVYLVENHGAQEVTCDKCLGLGIVRTCDDASCDICRSGEPCH